MQRSVNPLPTPVQAPPSASESAGCHKTVILTSHNLDMTKLWLLSANEITAPRFSLRLFSGQAALPPLTAAIFSAAYLIWAILSWPLPAESLPSRSNEQTLSVAEPDADAAPDYLEIADWHLFGLNQSPEQETVTTHLLATPLQLKLLGTFWMSDRPENRYAIIQSADGLQQKYREGDALPEDAVLQHVEKTRVVLKHLQRLESLAFEPNPVSFSAPNQ